DGSDAYTTNYSGESILLRRYSLKGSTYARVKELTLDKSRDGLRYNIQPLEVGETLHYISYQPYSTVNKVQSKIGFYSRDLEPVFEINEELSSYNIHCFSHDSILILKESINNQ